MNLPVATGVKRTFYRCFLYGCLVLSNDFGSEFCYLSSLFFKDFDLLQSFQQSLFSGWKC